MREHLELVVRVLSWMTFLYSITSLFLIHFRIHPGQPRHKIVPGSTFVKTPIQLDDDIVDSDDDNGVKDKRNGGIQWSGGERNDSSKKEKRNGGIHRSGDEKKYSFNKTHDHQSSKSRAPLVDKKQPSQTSYNRYDDRDKLVVDNLRSTNGVGRSRKSASKRKRDSDDDEEYTFSDEDMKKGGMLSLSVYSCVFSGLVLF
jgi:hypothetical protein